MVSNTTMVESATIDNVGVYSARGIHYGYESEEESLAYHLVNKPVSDFITKVYQEIGKLPDGSKVIDLGCGAGRFLRYAPTDRRWTFVGIDYDDIAIDEAQKFARKADRMIVDDITKPKTLQSLSDGTSRNGAVVAHRLLHGLPRRYHTAFMSGIADILEPGGSFFVTFAAAEYDWKAKALRDRGMYKSGDASDCNDIMFKDYGLQRTEPFLVYFLTAQEFVALAELAGFKVIDHEIIYEQSGYEHLRDQINTYHAFTLKK